ncbi:MAG: hypothetical protein IPH04_01720 [Saprospirales bacterium]|nr:hypothetical protein [Saprospirales bacterium]
MKFNIRSGLIFLCIVICFIFLSLCFLQWLITRPPTTSKYYELEGNECRIISAGINEKYGLVEIYLSGAQRKSDEIIINFLMSLEKKAILDDESNCYRQIVDSLSGYYVQVYHTNYLDVSEYYDYYDVRIRVEKIGNFICYFSTNELKGKIKETCFVREKNKN